MRYVLIENNKVINAILWDGISLYEVPENLTLIQNDYAIIGDIYNPETQQFISKE